MKLAVLVAHRPFYEMASSTSSSYNDLLWKALLRVS